MSTNAQDLTERAQGLNPFKAPKTMEDSTAAAGAMSAQAMASVQGAVLMAKKFPRNQEAAMERILDSCTRVNLANEAEYAYPRGGMTVSGPSIRLAEVIAQNWGNIDFGIIELSQEHGRSQVMAYCWDLETNVRQTKIFVAEHKMKAHGSIKLLTDPRDVYELTANQGARRLRACILGIVPKDVTEAAVQQCQVTLANSMQAPEKEIQDMVAAFEKLGVPEAAIKQRLGKSFKAVTAAEIIRMRSIYRSIQDEMSKPADWFNLDGNGDADTPEPQSGESTEALTKRLREGEDRPLVDSPEKEKDLDTTDIKDKFGTVFDPELHATTPKGEIIYNEDGSFEPLGSEDQEDTSDDRPI